MAEWEQITAAKAFGASSTAVEASNVEESTSAHVEGQPSPAYPVRIMQYGPELSERNHGEKLATFTGYAGEAKGLLRKMRLAIHYHAGYSEFDKANVIEDIVDLVKDLCTRKEQRDTSEASETPKVIDPTLPLYQGNYTSSSLGGPMDLQSVPKFVGVTRQANGLLRKMRLTIYHHVSTLGFDNGNVIEEILDLAKDILACKVSHDISKAPNKLGSGAVVDVPAVDTVVLVSIGEVLFYFDCEGIDLGRNGTLELLTIYMPVMNNVYIIDIKTIGRTAFSTPDEMSGTTLRNILEDPEIKKGIFDCRSDSDALHSHFGVTLSGVVDIQLQDIATRQAGSTSGLKGLSYCISQRLKLSAEDEKALSDINEWGKAAMNEGLEVADSRSAAKELQKEVSRRARFFDSTASGDGRVTTGLAVSGMTVRPLHEKVIEYCTADLVMLPSLFSHYTEHRFMSEEWKARVQQETENRLAWSRSPDFNQTPEVMKALPKGWGEIKRADKTKANVEDLAANMSKVELEQ